MTTRTETTQSRRPDAAFVATGRRTVFAVRLLAFLGGTVAALGLAAAGAYGAAAIVGGLVLLILLVAVGVEALLHMVQPTPADEG